MCACTCVVTQHMTSTQRTTKSSRTWLMARRRVVGNEPKGDVGEYSTISRKNIICNNSREIKDFTKRKGFFEGAAFLCDYCGLPWTSGNMGRRCSRCLTKVYCGEECRDQDWVVHKLMCREGEVERKRKGWTGR